MKKFIILFILSTSFVMAKDLSISLSPESTTVEAGKTARVRVSFSQAPKKFSASDISIEGGTVDSVRKLSTRVYLAVVRASEDVKDVELQIQADSVRDNEGDLNENASNSIRLKVTANIQKLEVENRAKAEQVKLENEKTLNSLLNIVTQTSRNNNTPAPTAPAPQVQYYNCNGQAIPTTQQCIQNANVNTNNVLYIPSGSYVDTYGNTYNPYGAYGTTQGYVVYPTGLYSQYEMNYYDRYYNNYGYYPRTYYTTYYNNYGYYPQTYYSSPYYEAGYGLGAGLRGLFDW